MSDDVPQMNELFLSLVFSLQSAGWSQLGKVASPVSGKIERDLLQAKMSIDLLVMLQEKTKGNLSSEEAQLLNSAVYNLQMNYVDEINNEKQASPSDNPSSAGDGEAPPSGNAPPDETASGA
jgi:hypothetical protein